MTLTDHSSSFAKIINRYHHFEQLFKGSIIMTKQSFETDAKNLYKFKKDELFLIRTFFTFEFHILNLSLESLELIPF